MTLFLTTLCMEPYFREVAEKS